MNGTQKLDRPDTSRPSAAARCSLLLFITIVVAATVALPVRDARAEVAQIPREGVFRRLGIGGVSADYVVLVDTSGSMQADGLFYRLKLSLLDFLAALSPSDHLSLITFDTTPHLRFSGRIGPSRIQSLRRFAAARNRRVDGTLFAQGAPIVSRLPRKATGAKTDIGAAIDVAVAEVERQRASQISSVIMFTDGKHDPPPGSPYPRAPEPNAVLRPGAWRRLSERGNRVERSRLLTSYSIALNSNTDAVALRRILGSTIVVDLPRGQLRGYLTRVKDITRIQKVRSLVQRDLRPTITVRWPSSVRDVDVSQGSLKTSVYLRGTSRTIPFVVKNPRIESSDPDLEVAPVRKQLRLLPGRRTELSLRLSWSRPGTFGFGERVEEIVDGGTLQLVHDGIESPWGRTLRSLQLGPHPRISNASTRVRVAGEVGWPWGRLMVVALLLVAFLAALVARWLQTHERLRGELLIQQPRSFWQTVQPGVTPTAADGEWLSVPLENRGVSFGRSEGLLGGRGRVRGRRPAWRGRSGVPELLISYSNDGSRRRMKTRTCALGGDVLINGAVFSYQLHAARRDGMTSTRTDPLVHPASLKE